MNAPYKIFHSLILASIFLLPCACQSPAPTPPPTDTTVPITELPQGTTIIRNGTIIDGRSPNPIPSGLVAFQDGLIIAVGPENAFHFPTQTQIFARKTVKIWQIVGGHRG